MWIFEGTCHNPGHGWKDGYTRGEKVFAYTRTLPPPYAPGQHPKVGNLISAVSANHFEFRRAKLLDVLRLIPTVLRDIKSRRKFRRIERQRIAAIIAWSSVAFLIGFIAGVLV